MNTEAAANMDGAGQVQQLPLFVIDTEPAA